MRDQVTTDEPWIRKYLLGINTTLLFGLLVAYVINRTEVWAALTSVPQSIATVLGIGAGFWTIALQAKWGFQNLILSQEHRAKLESDAKQAELKRDTLTAASGFKGELLALKDYAHLQHTLSTQMADHCGTLDAETRTSFPSTDAFDPIFLKASAGRLALIGPEAINLVIKAYAFVESSQGLRFAHPMPPAMLVSAYRVQAKMAQTAGLNCERAIQALDSCPSVI
jgi:hypothetical protein